MDEEDVKPDLNLLALAAEKRARKEHQGQQWSCSACTLDVSFCWIILAFLR